MLQILEAIGIALVVLVAVGIPCIMMGLLFWALEDFKDRGRL